MDWAFSGNARPVSTEQTLFEMFIAEWRLQRADTRLRSMLIVDDDPASQYLAPEFTLFHQLFRHHGVAAHITAAIEVEWRDNKLWHKGEQVDMVYNRLTDFYLEEPAHRALRSAYEAGAVVLTPHPHAHALHADKRNLIIFGQDDLLRRWGISADDRALLLSAVPYTRFVTADRADELWASDASFSSSQQKVLVPELPTAAIN